MDSDTKSRDAVVFTLRPMEEVRFSLDGNSKQRVLVTLLTGDAELFGSPLMVGRQYEMGAAGSIAFFSWTGGQVRVTGPIVEPYVCLNEGMQNYLALHRDLESYRTVQPRGPVVFVVGGTDTGKSTLTKILSSYACRDGREVVFVDLDIGQGTLPGMISAHVMAAPRDVEHDIDLNPPLYYFFGDVTPAKRIDLYEKCVEQLAGSVHFRLSSSEAASRGGVFVNTMGWTDGDGYRLLKHSMTLFQANFAFVIGDDRLSNKLMKDMPTVKVFPLAVSGGVVMRPRVVRRQTRDRLLHEYFYGKRGHFSPISLTLPFDDITIVSMGHGEQLSEQLLPMGAKSISDPMQPKELRSFSQELEKRILGVTFSKSFEDFKKSMDFNVSGIVMITRVDVLKRTITVLAPTADTFPGSVLLLSPIEKQ